MTARRAPCYGAPALGLWLLSIAFAGAASPEAAPYADGAAPGFTGGFKEQTCDACHFEGGINVKPGQLTISGVPERYAPGARYELTVTLTRPEMKIGGFQLAVRFEATGAQAGTLEVRPVDAKQIRVEISGGVQYANQLKAGTVLAAPGSASWTLEWTAPMASGPVVFHASANAANNDEFAGGDYVYTATARSQAVAANAQAPKQIQIFAGVLDSCGAAVRSLDVRDVGRVNVAVKSPLVTAGLSFDGPVR